MMKFPIGTPEELAAEDAALALVMQQPVPPLTPAERKKLRSIENKRAWRLAAEARRRQPSVPDEGEGA